MRRVGEQQRQAEMGRDCESPLSRIHSVCERGVIWPAASVLEKHQHTQPVILN